MYAYFVCVNITHYVFYSKDETFIIFLVKKKGQVRLMRCGYVKGSKEGKKGDLSLTQNGVRLDDDRENINNRC